MKIASPRHRYRVQASKSRARSHAAGRKTATSLRMSRGGAGLSSSRNEWPSLLVAPNDTNFERHDSVVSSSQCNIGGAGMSHSRPRPDHLPHRERERTQQHQADATLPQSVSGPSNTSDLSIIPNSQNATTASNSAATQATITSVSQMASGLRLSRRTPSRILMLRKLATQERWQRQLLPEIANENPWPMFHGDELIRRSRRGTQRDWSSTFCRIGDEVVDDINIDLLKGACKRRYWHEFFIPVSRSS